MVKLILKGKNGYKVINELEVNLQKISSTEIIPQYGKNNWYHEFSDKQLKNMIHNSIPELLTKTSETYISNDVMMQQYEYKFLYFLIIYIVKLAYNYKHIFLSFVVVSNTIFLVHQI